MRSKKKKINSQNSSLSFINYFPVAIFSYGIGIASANAWESVAGSYVGFYFAMIGITWLILMPIINMHGVD